MKIAYYFYNEYSRKFCDFLPDSIEIVYNSCDADVDLIYCGTISRLRDAFIAKLKYKKPLICWVWDIPYNWKEWPLVPEEMNFLPVGFFVNIPGNIEMLRQCDLVISASKTTQKVLQEKFNIKSEQLYFYTDFPIVDLNTIKKTKSIIQVSRFASHKRFEISIDAAQNIGTPLICAGRNKNDQYFEKLQAHAKRNVTFLHNIDQQRLIKELSKATVLVSPSIFEGWGLSPIEAVACGTPIIVNDIPVFREVYGDAAIYHKQDDVKDLQQKLTMVLNDTQLQKKIVKDCRKIIAPFTPKLFAKRWMKLIDG